VFAGGWRRWRLGSFTGWWGVMAVSPEAWSAVAAGISALVALVAAVAAWRQVGVSGKQITLGELQITLGEQQVAVAEAEKEAAQQQVRASSWNMIAQLDATLRGYEAERKWVNEQAKKPLGNQQLRDQSGLNRHRINGYMGVFERLEELLETGLVGEKTAHTFYGSRLRALLKTARARNILKRSPGGWTSFISLSLRLDDYGRDKGKAVIVVPGSNAESQAKPDEDYRTTLETFLYKLAVVGDEDATSRLTGLLAERGELGRLQALAAVGDGYAARRVADRGDVDRLPAQADADGQGTAS